MRRVICLATLLCFEFAGLPAFADNADLTARLQDAYQAHCDDLVHANLDAYRDSLSPTFFSRTNGQTLTRDENVANVKTLLAQGLTFTRCSTTIDSATENAGTVAATITEHFYGFQDKKHSIPIEIDGSSNDAWSDDGATLVELSSVSVWATASVSGKIVTSSGTVPTAAPSVTPAPAASPLLPVMFASATFTYHGASPHGIVRAFYAWYFSVVPKPGGWLDHLGGAQSLLDPEFFKTLQTAGALQKHDDVIDYDPYIDAQIFAKTVDVGIATTAGTTATVPVTVHYLRDSQSGHVKVVLRTFGGRWLIEDFVGARGGSFRQSLAAGIRSARR